MENPTTPAKFKVVLVFRLRAGMANEELRRSGQARSFPNMLASQPGCERIELVKIDDDKTMSIQTWTTQGDWWTALETVKSLRKDGPSEEQPTDEILESRDYFGGTIVSVLEAARQ